MPPQSTRSHADLGLLVTQQGRQVRISQMHVSRDKVGLGTDPNFLVASQPGEVEALHDRNSPEGR